MVNPQQSAISSFLHYRPVTPWQPPLWFALPLLFAAIFTAGCSSLSLEARAQRLGWDYGSAGPATLAAQWLYKPLSTVRGPLHVYLEGDGRPWSGGEPAEDPTGRRLVALDLLMADAAGGFYVARPCYHRVGAPAACQTELWTSHRYGPEMVSAMRAAIEELEQRTASSQGLRLIGYSGGGTLAMLIAAQMGREDISVITIASNLDTEAWTALHRVTPLDVSSNPARLPPGVKGRAVHLQGGRDRIVPPASTAGYQARFPEQPVHLYPDFDHHCCWLQQWPAVLERAIRILDQDPL